MTCVMCSYGHFIKGLVVHNGGSRGKENAGKVICFEGQGDGSKLVFCFWAVRKRLSLPEALQISHADTQYYPLRWTNHLHPFCFFQRMPIRDNLDYTHFWIMTQWSQLSHQLSLRFVWFEHLPQPPYPFICTHPVNTLGGRTYETINIYSVLNLRSRDGSN